MKVNFKYVLLSLFAYLSLSVLITHNYNYSKVHEQALISEPLYIQTRPIPNAQHKVYIPLLIDSFQLKKYLLKDTNYHAQQQDLSADDQFLLFNMDPPRHFFSQQSIFIESYQLLQLRKFSIKVSNPSKKFRICVSDIISDRLEVRRQEERGILPLCLEPQEKYNFNFAFYAAWLNPQYVQGAIYFFVQIYDGKVLAQEKVYARKILVTIKPNHFRIQTPVFRNCPRHNAVMLKNYQIFEICIIVEGKKKFQTMQGVLLDKQICIAPTKSIKILLQGKTTQMLVHTRGPPAEPPFSSLFLQTMCEQPVTLDYFNIGILPQERTIFEYPLTLSSSHTDNLMMQEIIIQSSSQTVTFEEMPIFKGFIPSSAKNLQIGMVKILARKQPERKSIINIRIRISTSVDQFWTSQKFIYQELRNPISAGARRFIDLRKPQGNSQRFSLKNNLNIPIFITKLFYDETIMELSWIGQRRKIVPPNHSIQELAFKYIGPKSIGLSPQKYILIIQFNGNLLVPFQIVLYDQTLQCLVDNQAKKCMNVSFLDFGYFRDKNSKSKQIVLRNWNPQGLHITLQVPTIQSKQNNINFSLQIYGPLPSDELYVNDHNYKDFFLKPNHFMVINIIIQPMQNATSVSLPFAIFTNQQVIQIVLIIKIENGTIALIPQVVRFQNPIGKTIQYINLVSTYEQKYKISSVSTNLSTIIVAIPPHVQLHGNQFVGMTVVYNPQKDQNITESDWSSSKKQSEYFLYRVKKQYQNIVFAQIKLVTSTELEARSTVIIQKNYIPMIANSQKEETDRGVRTVRYILTKRKFKSVRYNQPKQIYQISVNIENNFPLNLKYKPLLLSQIKFIHLESFFRMYRMSKQQIIEEIFFCVSQKTKDKTRMSVMQVRDIFNLQQVPQQYIMQVTNPKAERPIISMYTFKNQRNETIQIVPNTKSYFYLLKAFENQCKICYFFLHHQIINRLILSQLLYKVLVQEGQRTLKQFVRNQIQNLQSISFFQNDTFSNIKTKQSYHQYCYDIRQYAIYRFCDNLNSKVFNITTLDNKKIKENNDLTYSMFPRERHKINLQLINPLDSFKFYLVLANNHTKFQTYQIQIDIKEPSLYVRNGFISPQFSQIYEQSWGKSKGINLLPIQLFHQDYHNQDNVFEGTRRFEIVNEGLTDIFISHIGIDEKEKTCSQKGIIIYGLSCGEDEEIQLLNQSSKNNKQTSFTIKSMSKYNLTIKFLLNLKFWPNGKKKLSLLSKQSLRYMVYLYDQKGYYYKLQLIFRIGDTNLAQSIDQYINPNNIHNLYRYLSLNIISLLIIYLLLSKMKEEQSNFHVTIKEERQKSEQDPFRRMLRYKRLTRAVKQNRYEESDMIVGVRLNKKAVERPIHKVTEDLVLSAKEVTQRDLKKYFNQSQQSAIGVILEMNHHFSLSQSISDQGVHQQPQIEEIMSQPSQKSSVRSSNLPEGQEVDLTDEIDQDSWYDFNREATNESNNRSNRNINTSQQNEVDQQQFYNVFRSDISLKKDSWHQKSTKSPKKSKFD